MNAYELADKLDEYNKDGMPVYIISEAVELLREQADRIELLEKRFGEELNAHHSVALKNGRLRRKIVELEKVIKT